MGTHHEMLAGIVDGTKLLVVASLPSEKAAVRSAVEMPGLIGFKDELLRYARRRNINSTAAPAPPSGPYTFAAYKALDIPGAHPGQSESLKLLHRLAADPGIVGSSVSHLLCNYRLSAGRQPWSLLLEL